MAAARSRRPVRAHAPSALRRPPGASGSRVTPEVAGRARAGGAATFVIPCGRERESGAVEPPVSGGGGGGGQGEAGRGGTGRAGAAGPGVPRLCSRRSPGWARASSGATARVPRRPRPRRCSPADWPAPPPRGWRARRPHGGVVPSTPPRAARPPAQIAERCGRKCGPRPSLSEDPVPRGHTWVASGREPSRGIPEEAAGRPGTAAGPTPPAAALCGARAAPGDPRRPAGPWGRAGRGLGGQGPGPPPAPPGGPERASVSRGTLSEPPGARIPEEDLETMWALPRFPNRGSRTLAVGEEVGGYLGLLVRGRDPPVGLGLAGSPELRCGDLLPC